MTNLKLREFVRVFIKEYCIINDNSHIRRKYLWEAVNKFKIKYKWNDDDHFFVHPGGFSLHLSRIYNIKFKSSASKEYDEITLSRVRVRYIGIALNEKGWKEFFPDDHRKMAILDAKHIENIENISSANACIAISCNLTTKRFEELYDNFGVSVRKEIDKKRVIKNIRQIEKVMHRKNVYRRTQSKIGLGIWISSSLTLRKTSELVDLGIKGSTISNLYHKLGLNKLGLKGEVIKQ